MNDKKMKDGCWRKMMDDGWWMVDGEKCKMGINGR